MRVVSRKVVVQRRVVLVKRAVVRSSYSVTVVRNAQVSAARQAAIVARNNYYAAFYLRKYRGLLTTVLVSLRVKLRNL